MSKRHVYFLPEGINDIHELFESDGFKEFMGKKTNSKTSLWTFTLKNGIQDKEGNIIGLFGRDKEQAMVTQYLRGVLKAKK